MSRVWRPIKSRSPRSLFDASAETKIISSSERKEGRTPTIRFLHNIMSKFSSAPKSSYLASSSHDFIWFLCYDSRALSAMFEQPSRVRLLQIGFRIDSISNMWRNSQSFPRRQMKLRIPASNFCFLGNKSREESLLRALQNNPSLRNVSVLRSTCRKNDKNLLTATTKHA